MEKATETRVLQSDFLSDAEDATKREHDLTLLQAIRLYPKAVAWSIMMSTTLVMDGYDLKLIGSLFAQPAFSKAYGKAQADGSYQISAPWQAGLNNGSNAGQMLGLLVAGSIVERLGFRRSMMMALAVVPALIFIQFFATSLAVLQTGQVLLGESTEVTFDPCTDLSADRHSTRHVSDHHVCLRCRGDADMPSRIPDQLCQHVLGKPTRSQVQARSLTLWQLMGQLIASGVLRGVLAMDAPWAYRVPFAVQ